MLKIDSFRNNPYLMESLKELVRSGLPFLFLFISILCFNHDRSDYHLPPWQGATGDAGDYRYLAEHFWGLPHRLDTYNSAFSRHWAYFLDHVPFRQIGVGTFYILFTSLFYSHDCVTAQLDAASHWIPLILTGALMVCYLFFYTACRKVYGWKPALAAYVCLIFPPHYWAMTGELLTEPFLRICLVCMLSVMILFQTGRFIGLKTGLVYFFMFVAVQIRAQWLPYACLVLPFLLLFFMAHKRYRLVWISPVLTLLLPLSLYLVNVTGWDYPAVTTVTGFQENLLMDGKLMDYAASCFESGTITHPLVVGRIPVYLQEGAIDDWWHIPFPFPCQDDPPSIAGLKSDYQLLDKLTMAYLFADWKSRIVLPFVKGFFMLTNFPGGVFGDDSYEDPPLFYRIMDGLVVLILVCGLFFSKTRLVAAAAISLWIIPASGNVFSIYVVRYLRPMAMLPFSAALIISFALVKGMVARNKIVKPAVKTL